MLDSLKEILSKPLSGLEAVIVLVICFVCFYLLARLERWRVRRKARKFPVRHPDAAMIYLYIMDQPVRDAKIACEKGKMSQAFPVKDSGPSEVRKGAACYASPGPVEFNVLVSCGARRSDAGARHRFIGHFSFCAEQNGVYDVVFDARSGRSRLIVRKGQNTDVEMGEEKDLHTRDQMQGAERRNIWGNSEKSGILPYLYRRELKRLLLTCGFKLLQISYLVFVVNQPIYYMLLPGVLFLGAVIRLFATGARRFHSVFNALSPHLQERIQQSFQNPHPVYKLSMGEAHLLPDCVVLRQGGRLSVILLDQIEVVQKVRNSRTYGLVGALVIQTVSGGRYRMEFSGRHQKEIPDVVSWIKSKNPQVFAEI